MRSISEGRVGAILVADAPVVDAVVRGLVVHCGGGAHGAWRINHGRQLVVVDLDQQGGVGFGLLQRLGHHQRHPVADVAHLAVGQDRVLGLLHRTAVQAVDQPAAGQAADGLEVLAGEDAQHARRRRGGGGRQRDAGVRIGRAQEDA
jgi:hypothetical protein